MDDVQKITDELASSLNRAVFVDDASFRPLATSVQIGLVDEARVQALLDRGPTEEHLRYFIDHGVTEARVPLRVPGSAEHRLLPRVVIPITSGGRTLARVWLIDADPPVTDDDIARAVDVCREMRRHLLESSAAARHIAVAGDLLRDIHDAGRRRRQALFERLSEDYEVGGLEHAHVCVIQLGRNIPLGAADEMPWYDGFLATFIEILNLRGAVAYERGHALIMLVSSREVTGRKLVQSIWAAAHRSATLHDVSVKTVGVGGALGSENGFELSLRQAEFAARIAGRVSALKGRVHWDDIGTYRLFFAVEWDHAGVASINPGVAELLAERRTPLAATLLAYLERDGDVSAAAAELQVHRTTLYYRIERAKEILRDDLAGESLFAIHAALRLADLAGLCAPALRE